MEDKQHEPPVLQTPMEKFGDMTDEYVKTYGRQLYDSIADSVGHTLKSERNGVSNNEHGGVPNYI
jgi:hypothetical protein